MDILNLTQPQITPITRKRSRKFKRNPARGPKQGHSRSEWSGVFDKPSASLLASGFAKTPPTWPAQVPLFVSFRDFRGSPSSNF